MRFSKILSGATVCFLFLFGIQSVHGQKTIADVKARVQQIATNPGLVNGVFGFCLIDVETGTILAENQSKMSLLPASTLKTVTSGAALGILGEDFKFKTLVEYIGVISDSILHGDIYIRGGGDPTLGYDRYPGYPNMDDLMRLWADKIKAAGIKGVEGRIIGDDEIFETNSLPITWVWSDMGNYYGAGPSGLTINENLYTLYFKPGASVGSVAELIRCEPKIPGLEFVNEMKTGGYGSGDNGYIYGSPYTYLRYLRGTIPMGKSEFSIKGSIPDPALFCAQLLKDCMIEKGQSVSGIPTSTREIKTKTPLTKEARKAIYTNQSPPLKDIVFWLNKRSINLYAEHLLKYLGYFKSNDGSTEGGAEVIKNYWATKGIDVKGLHLMDGSGLSRYNGITPAQLAGILRAITKESFYETFYNSLPCAGDPEDVGSIRDMCMNTAAAKNVRAKSGYIMRVRTYAGYVTTKSGKKLSFAMMPNNFTCNNTEMKKMLEDLMVLLAELA